MSSSSAKKAAAKKASARQPRAEAKAAAAEETQAAVGSALALTAGETQPAPPALTAGETQPAPPLTTAGDGPAAAPGSDVSLPSEQQPLTQPEHETGLIEPQAGATPPADIDQPTTAETQTPTPPPDEGGGEGGEVTAVEMPPAFAPDMERIAAEASYATAPAEPGAAVASGYYLPPPPDLRGNPKKRK